MREAERRAPARARAPRRRKANLQARSKAKVDRKKAKREKQLLRAGFEGRKAGFIGGAKWGKKPAAS